MAVRKGASDGSTPKKVEFGGAIIRQGETFVVPEGLPLTSAIKALERLHESEEQVVDIHVDLDVPVLDAAYALVESIKRTTGMLLQNKFTPNWFKESPQVKQLEVPVSLTESVSVPWGRFELPGMEGGTITTTHSRASDGRIIFHAHAHVKRKYEKPVRNLLDLARHIALTESLHRGKAFRIRFRDIEGDPIALPMPEFFKLSDEEPIFNLDLENAIERNILTPIKYFEQMRGAGESCKRGTLFAGSFGTGKTLLASKIARFCEEHTWTFMYVKDSSELPQALQLAQHYQPCAVFAEDVDRVASGGPGGSRSDAVNELLNQVDGVDSKGSAIMLILTTNEVDNIHPAMKRPGRIDQILPVEAPNSDTVARMIQRFANGRLEENTDLSAAGDLLAGQSPAKIVECVKRAKYEALTRSGNIESLISGQDVYNVALELKKENDLFGTKVEPETDAARDLGDALVRSGKAVLAGVSSNGSHATPVR